MTNPEKTAEAPGKGLYEGLTFRRYSDGNHIWLNPKVFDVTIERLVGKGAGRRRKWHIVNRGSDAWGLKPPILYGPFENIKVAVTTHRILYG